MTEERIGVYVCHCGSNIAGMVDVEDVAQWAGENLEDRGVVVVAITAIGRVAVAGPTGRRINLRGELVERADRAVPETV